VEGPTLDAALATEEMKALLGVFADARYPALTDHFRRLHNKQDRSSLGGLVNSEGIIEDFLKKADVSFQPAKRFGNAYSWILKTVPDYLDPPLEFMTEMIIPVDTSLSEAQKKKLIKERLKEYFRYIDKPPRWIQGPDWPIRNGTPLIFIGQVPIDASDLFHDKGAAYVFFDVVGGGFETVAQFY
jgi:hypothetical protein